MRFPLLVIPKCFSRTAAQRQDNVLVNTVQTSVLQCCSGQIVSCCNGRRLVPVRQVKNVNAGVANTNATKTGASGRGKRQLIGRNATKLARAKQGNRSVSARAVPPQIMKRIEARARRHEELLRKFQ
jgi:hypothetical protein